MLLVEIASPAPIHREGGNLYSSPLTDISQNVLSVLMSKLNGYLYSSLLPIFLIHTQRALYLPWTSSNFG